MQSSKKWVVWLVGLFAAALVVLSCMTAWIDPYFHYHKPLSYVKYELKQQRYQNNGIVKHFDYDAIITGSSMTECFRTSELDALFGVSSVKVPYSGGSFKEVNDNLKVAVEKNPDLKMVVRCIDSNRLFDEVDAVDYDNYPDYLYDDNPLNDAAYLLNKSILLTGLQNLNGYLQDGAQELSFDLYCNWSDYATYGKEAVERNYQRDEVPLSELRHEITAEEYARMDANIEQNLVALARENPQIEFYYYFTPNSIYCMDYWNRQGNLQKQLDAERYFIEKLLPYENIHLFSFYTEYDTICDLNNYMDVAHHTGELNSQILVWMKEGRHELTKENYETYCQAVRDFYCNYDYDAMFE